MGSNRRIANCQRYPALCAIACALLLPPTLGAQTVRSRGEINDNGATWQPGTATLPVNAMGASIAAAYTNAAGEVNGAKAAAPARSYVGIGANAAAVASATAVLDSLAASALAVPASKTNPTGHREAITALQNRVSTCTVVDTTLMRGACMVTAGSGTFPLAAKALGTPISADAGVVLGMADGITIETARASASQTLSMRNVRGVMVTINTPNEAASASLEKGGGKGAFALAVNRDPMAVDWASASDRSVSYDLSNVSLGPLTSDLGSSAISYFSTSTAFVDGTSKLDVAESSAVDLFTLVLGASSDDGEAAILDTLILDVPCASSATPTCAVTYTLGGELRSGLAELTADLLASFRADAGGRWRFVIPLSFTVTVPGTALQSVLFMEDQGLVAVRAAAPGTVLLVLCGLAGLPLCRRR